MSKGVIRKMKLNLVFVPTWLERALKAYGEPVHAVLEREKLVRIVSKADVDLYDSVQRSLSTIFTPAIANSFNTPNLAEVSAAPVALTEEARQQEDEQIRGYLYGFLPDTENLPTRPGFKITMEGYSQVIVTVDTTPGSEVGAFDNLMNALLHTVNSALPLEEVAKLPLFQSWLESRAQTNRF